jgi:hypothetical protein
MNFVYWHAMDFGFGCRQTRKNFTARSFDCGIELRAPEQIADLFPRARRFMLGRNDLELRGAERVNGLFSGVDLEFQRWDFLQLASEPIQRQPEIDERGDKHVPTDSSDQVTVGYFHLRRGIHR